MVKEIQNKSQFNSLVIANDEVVVEFYQSQGCVPCKRLAPHFEAASEKSDLPFVKVDLLNPEMFEYASVYDVMSTPTVVVMERGVIVKTLLGRTVIALLNELE